ncbi:hypothetical protein PoB_006803100 [Plakobranchus ocellatus]|uniref:Uncharacterized protein n=1 Tax=Plakobranchus ocellatus TaxID=259542 RepID=A0AAV4DBS9_9GAST|nr:hypothetical protein PoB_006803100 [Plakobranchus ocellatus]
MEMSRPHNVRQQIDKKNNRLAIKTGKEVEEADSRQDGGTVLYDREYHSQRLKQSDGGLRRRTISCSGWTQTHSNSSNSMAYSCQVL